MKIGKSIKIILDATKLTRGQLAQHLGICKSYLCIVESGKISGGRKMLRRISKKFNIPAIYMIAASDDKFGEQFPGTYRSIKNQMEALAAAAISTPDSQNIRQGSFTC
jgi:transcriptional regulator with XRE-family HTH domain